MNCESFRKLTPQEQADFIGKLVVVVQTKEGGFMAAKTMIEAAEMAGVFARVKVGSEVYAEEGAMRGEVFQ